MIIVRELKEILNIYLNIKNIGNAIDILYAVKYLTLEEDITRYETGEKISQR